jgi:hypothetical protein
VQWLNATAFTANVPQRLDAPITAGTIRPCIGVFGFTALGRSQALNSEGIGRYRDHVARDIVHWGPVGGVRTVRVPAASFFRFRRRTVSCSSQ